MFLSEIVETKLYLASLRNEDICWEHIDVVVWVLA